MLTCKDVTERATDYLEADLSWADWIRVRLHLAMCAVCRRYVDQMRTTRDVLRRLGETLRGDAPLDASTRELFQTWRDESRRP